MEPRDSCGLRADGRVSYSASPSRAGRSSQSTWSRTPTAYASSTWRSSASDERSVQDRVTLFDAALVQRHALPGEWAGTARLWIDGQTEVLRPSLVMLDVGLVGFGFAGKVFHAPVIRAVAGLRLTTIVQRSGGGAPDPRYADVEVVRSVDDLLTRAIDVVVIATPNTSHHPIAKQCLLAGRHVVIDKPFAPTLPEAQDLVALAQKQRRRRARALQFTAPEAPSSSTEWMHRKRY